MSKRNVINEGVAITSMGFYKNLEPYPRRMEYRGRSYDFIEMGLKCLVKQGERIAQVMSLSDGAAWYQLKYDQSNASWTLMAITHG
jgi:hypothetical protein